MNTQIKEIEIVLENCDYILLSTKQLGMFLIDDIHITIHRNALNSISKFSVADTIFIEIYNRKKNQKLYRLHNHHDITSIWITYENDEQECYYCNYEEPERTRRCTWSTKYKSINFYN